MNIKIRKFKNSDIDFILNNWANTDKLAGIFKNTTREKLEQNIEEFDAEKTADEVKLFVYCIECENRPVGMISMTEKYPNKINFGIAIEDIYRGKGIATKAFEIIKQMMIEKGYQNFTSSCRQDNIPSVNMHKKFGFKIVKEELSPNGTPMYRWEYNI